MVGPYLEDKDWKEIEERMNRVIDDTVYCWKRTRILGISASLACEGNISMMLLGELDRIKDQLEKAHDEK